MSTERSELNAKLSRGKYAATQANTVADAAREKFQAAMDAASGDKSDPRVREAAIEAFRAAKKSDEESGKYRSYLKDQAQKAAGRFVFRLVILLLIAWFVVASIFG